MTKEKTTDSSPTIIAVLSALVGVTVALLVLAALTGYVLWGLATPGVVLPVALITGYVVAVGGGIVLWKRTFFPPGRSLQAVYKSEIRRAAAQEERNRLARDLHDSIKQQIFAIQTGAAAAQVRFDNDPAGAREALEGVRASAREAMAEMEAMLDQLRAAPLESVGLIEAIRKQCEALRFRTGAQVDVELTPIPDGRQLTPGAAESLFRIVQEALSNVARHARATEIRVNLAVTKGSLELRIQDNGAGFREAEVSPGMGLSNMRSRAAELRGSLAVTSTPGGGTQLMISIPLKASRNQMLLRKAWGFGAAAVAVVLVSFAIPNQPLPAMARGFAIGLLGSAATQYFAWRRS
jgi:signal transduction histidine kinase